jgi:hypothetical protein
MNALHPALRPCCASCDAYVAGMSGSRHVPVGGHPCVLVAVQLRSVKIGTSYSTVQVVRQPCDEMLTRCVTGTPSRIPLDGMPSIHLPANPCLFLFFAGAARGRPWAGAVGRLQHSLAPGTHPDTRPSRRNSMCIPEPHGNPGPALSRPKAKGPYAAAHGPLTDSQDSTDVRATPSREPPHSLRGRLVPHRPLRSLVD